MEVKFDNVKYIDSDGTTQLQDISFVASGRKVTVVMGKSGSGKSILREMLQTIKFPMEGVISVGPFIIKAGLEKFNYAGLYRLVGVVEQYPERNFIANTVREEIAFAMKQYKYHPDKIEQHILASLKMVDLDESYLDKNPFRLSLGEKKKIAFAAVLAYNPSVIILDEPTVGLDSYSKGQWIRTIRSLKRKYNKTILIMSRDSDFAVQVADQVVILNRGKIYLSGKKMEVFQQVKKLERAGISIPKTILFSKKVLDQKKIKLGYRDDINDLIKDVYRHAK